MPMHTGIAHDPKMKGRHRMQPLDLTRFSPPELSVEEEQAQREAAAKWNAVEARIQHVFVKHFEPYFKVAEYSDRDWECAWLMVAYHALCEVADQQNLAHGRILEAWDYISDEVRKRQEVE